MTTMIASTDGIGRVSNQPLFSSHSGWLPLGGYHCAADLSIGSSVIELAVLNHVTADRSTLLVLAFGYPYLCSFVISCTYDAIPALLQAC